MADKWTRLYTSNHLINEQKLREKGFKIKKDYECFCLCSKYDKNGKFLYNECFGWFELGKYAKQNYIQQDPTAPRAHKPYSTKQMRGGR